MCGIIGYIGKKQALPVIMEGLKRLKYRGYDSAGLVIFDRNNNSQPCEISDSRISQQEHNRAFWLKFFMLKWVCDRHKAQQVCYS